MARHTARSICPLTSAAVVLAASLLVAGSGEPELEKGIRQVKDGDFEAALVTLDSLARDLAARPQPPADLVTAYVWLGAAYVGLDQEALAIAKFEQALRLDARLTLSAETFPPKVLRFFEAAKRRIAEEATLKKQAGAKPRKKGLLLAGVGGAAAAGIALAVKPGERKNTPPSARIATSPEGGAIAFVTQMTFTAQASDAEGDPLSHQWGFGDGVTASGPTVTHVFTIPSREFPFFEHTFSVSLTVSDGLAQTSATASVTVLFFEGSWRVATPTFDRIVQIDFNTGPVVAGGRAISATAHTASGEIKRGQGTITHPRRVQFDYSDCLGSRTFRFNGEIGSDLSTIQGTYTCEGRGRGESCQTCAGQQQPLVLRR